MDAEMNAETKEFLERFRSLDVHAQAEELEKLADGFAFILAHAWPNPMDWFGILIRLFATLDAISTQIYDDKYPTKIDQLFEKLRRTLVARLDRGSSNMPG